MGWLWFCSQVCVSSSLSATCLRRSEVFLSPSSLSAYSLWHLWDFPVCVNFFLIFVRSNLWAERRKLIRPIKLTKNEKSNYRNRSHVGLRVHVISSA